MSDKKFKRFGKYLILDHIVDGGMAKICRARYLGEQANKIVAVKMILPQFSKDPAFVQMFQDELKVSFGLMHPNIAQIYDYGKVDDRLYTAMEYVDGLNLKQYLERLKEKNYVFPVEISVYITSQVCQGLYYAHTFSDKLTGKPLNIIHRDISPHNIMLTFDGAVKVIDFGIAKSTSNSEATQAGTIKGKLSYLAPEYLEGHELDARYDIFAVGITLWELLCSRKLFTAANDLAVLKQIQACKITPPSQINPNVPKELDEIVMKALSKDPQNRYENMDQFNRSLVKFLYSSFPDFNATDLAYFAKELFKEEIATDKKKFVEFGKLDVSQYIQDLNNESSGSSSSSAAPGQTRRIVPKKRLELELGDTSTDVKLDLNREQKTGTRKITRAQVKNNPQLADSKAQHASKINIKSSTGTTSLKGRTTTRSKRSSTPVESNQNSLKGKVFIPFMVAGVCAFAYLSPGQFEEYTGINPRKYLGGIEKVSSSENESKQNTEPTKERRIASEVGYISLIGMDLSMDVYINGKKEEYAGVPLEAPLNQRLVLAIKKKGYKSYMEEITLVEGKKNVVVEVPSLERTKSGLLSSSLNYPSGSKLVYEIDGVRVEQELPFESIEFPEGKYHATIVNRVLGTEKEVEFTILENQENLLD